MPPRVRVDADLGRDSVILEGAAAHHLAHVLRLRPGARVTAFDGSGSERPMRVHEIDGERVVLAGDGDLAHTGAPALLIVVVQAMVKGDKMPRIVRACTELGVSRIVPVVTERTIARPVGERSSARADRLARVASEAARQCGRADVPPVLPPELLGKALERLPAGLRIALWEEEDRPLADALPLAQPTTISILVGPEGGLTRSDVAIARGAGFVTASLGPRILRTESVAPAVLAILQHRYGDLGSIDRPGGAAGQSERT